MAKHEFGLMEIAPVHGVRYDAYEPQKYHAISVDDRVLDPFLGRFLHIDTFWHSLDVPMKGLNETGITLIPPASHPLFDCQMDGDGLSELKRLFEKAMTEGKFIIHFGL